MQFRMIPLGTGGTYRFERIPVSGPPAIEWYEYFSRYRGVLIDIETYRPVPPQISTVTEIYRSVQPSVVLLVCPSVLKIHIGMYCIEQTSKLRYGMKFQSLLFLLSLKNHITLTLMVDRIIEILL
ncbi:unnamed protein product [Musa textilis]